MMQVEVHVQFASPSEDDWADMYAGNRLDSAIAFPKSEAEQARAKRKAERRRTK